MVVKQTFTPEHIVLTLIETKKIKVCLRRGHVYYWNKKEKRWIRRKYGTDHTGRYKRVSLRYRGIKKDILLHRVIWIAAHKIAIPDDCELHHGEKGRHNNSISNLTLLSREEHFIKHYGYPPSWDEPEF